ncbi:transcription termination/antitermination protein NusG [Aureimonas pseudogalii]|uniref:Transcription antitermination factor NusG n=1 Tax=Aureimonas pseudogalii TaxID=1744844 RepID=A0A7W6E8X7_9HYPH|nr:transcription termination/antitermination NusG family protein [Aureimonas pseudogalii]MBB3996893.1 transcription antitermination factor NusG [Aureimonas pseudogalii]
MTKAVASLASETIEIIQEKAKFGMKASFPTLAEQAAWLERGETWVAPYAKPRLVEQGGETVWFVVKTNPRCEERVTAGLLARGFQAHLPRGVKHMWRRHKRTKTAVSFPLLTGYLFAGLSVDSPSFYDLRQVDGVHSVLGRRMDDLSAPERSRYVPIAAGIVDAFRAIEAAGVVGTLEEEGVRFQPGDTVTVKDGPLRGVTFVFDDYFGKHSAKVIPNICGALHPIKIDVANLKLFA